MNLNKQSDLISLTTRLTHEDSSYSTQSKFFKSIYRGFGLLFVFLITLHFYTGESLPTILRSICFCLAMISFAFIFQKQQIDFKNVDYSLPTLEMLKKAKKRYTPFGNGGALVIVPIILADIGLSITLSAIDMITFQLLYFGVILFAMLMGLLVWKIKYKPLYDNICSLIKEINQ